MVKQSREFFHFEAFIVTFNPFIIDAENFRKLLKSACIGQLMSKAGGLTPS
jgi:hypothetical protein